MANKIDMNANQDLMDQNYFDNFDMDYLEQLIESKLDNQDQDSYQDAIQIR